MASISSHAVQSLINYLSVLGVSRQSCLTQIDITQASLNRKSLIDIDKYQQLYQYAQNELNEPLLGFNYGQHIDANRWGILGQIIYSSSTIEQALQNQRQYQSLVGNLGDPNFSIENNVLNVTWSPAKNYSHHIAQELLTSWVEFARRVTASKITPKQVWFCHHTETESAVELTTEKIKQYQDYFGCSVSFNHADFKTPQQAGLTVDADILNMPCTTANPELNRILKNYANSLISQYSMNNPVSVARDYIASQLPHSVPSLKKLSAILAVSERTLQRRLTEFDSSFKILVDDVKKDIATHYLINTQLSFHHISFMLGFSEQSAFSRAVKRWTTLSPADYRTKNQVPII